MKVAVPKKLIVAATENVGREAGVCVNY